MSNMSQGEIDCYIRRYPLLIRCIHQTSTTYDAFMYLSLPVPQGKQKVVLYQLIDNFVQTEVMENDDAWYVPPKSVREKSSLTYRPLQELSTMQSATKGNEKPFHCPATSCSTDTPQAFHNHQRGILGQIGDTRHFPCKAPRPDEIYPAVASADRG